MKKGGTGILENRLARYRRGGMEKRDGRKRKEGTREGV
jgi:hypothetical protein